MIRKQEENGFVVNLVQNKEDISYIRENLKGTVGVDTETTGLSFISDKVVGVCLGFGHPVQGYYLPIAHTAGKNLNKEEVLELTQEVINNYKTIYFNRNFDYSMLEKEGVYIPYEAKAHDVQIMAWEATNEKFPSLKDFSRRLLRYKMSDFTDNFEGNTDYNFGNTDPEASFPYAAFDPVATLMLGRKLWADYPYIRRIYPLDNRVTEAVRRMSQTDVQMDYLKVRQYLEEKEADLRMYRAKATSLAGYQFNLGSNKDKAEALSRFVTLTHKTDKGAFSVKEEVLENIDHPMAEYLLGYSLTMKFVSSYLKPLLAHEGKPLRFNYKLVEAPTGRTASGSSKGNDYYARLNVQSVPKDEVKRYIHEGGELGYYLSNEKEGSVGVQKVKAGLREAFIAPEGWWFATCDYSQEELVIVSNLSKERTFLDAILRGEDLHTNTAKAVFGVSDDESRGRIKILNFMTLYGANEWTISLRMKIAVEKAKEMLTLYYSRLPSLSKWKKDVVDEARRKGIVFTYYGRPRLLYKYYQSSDYKLKAFADRSAVNSIVQGCLPSRVLMEVKDGYISPLHFQAKSFIVDSPKGLCEATVSNRGENYILKFSSSSGDFGLCDTNHKLVRRRSKGIYETVSVRDCINSVVSLAPLQRKRPVILKKLWNFIKRSNRAEAYLISKTSVRRESVNKSVSSAIWSLFLTRRCLKIDDLYKAASLRSICSVYGFNLVETGKNKYGLRFSRSSRTRIRTFSPLQKDSVASMTLRNSIPVYASQGFLHRNTGADILRLTLCRIYGRKEVDKEFDENVIVVHQIHDEVNFYIRKPYLHKAFKIIKEMMTIRNENWEADLNSVFGVGPSWGSCIDVKDISEDNKIII